MCSTAVGGVVDVRKAKSKLLDHQPELAKADEYEPVCKAQDGFHAAGQVPNVAHLVLALCSQPALGVVAAPSTVQQQYAFQQTQTNVAGWQQQESYRKATGKGVWR